MIVTEWKQLEGKTIKMVERFFLGGYLLTFEDGDYAHIDGDGEEHHGAHWPILSDDYEGLVLKEAANGEVSSNTKGRCETPDPQLEACCDAIWRYAFHNAKAPT